MEKVWALTSDGPASKPLLCLFLGGTCLSSPRPSQPESLAASRNTQLGLILGENELMERVLGSSWNFWDAWEGSLENKWRQGDVVARTATVTVPKVLSREDSPVRPVGHWMLPRYVCSQDGFFAAPVSCAISS